MVNKCPVHGAYLIINMKLNLLDLPPIVHGSGTINKNVFVFASSSQYFIRQPGSDAD